MKIKEGAPRFYIKRGFDPFGCKLAEPTKEPVVCNDCEYFGKLKVCPLASWSYIYDKAYCDRDKDYCSRFKFRKGSDESDGRSK